MLGWFIHCQVIYKSKCLLERTTFCNYIDLLLKKGPSFNKPIITESSSFKQTF